MTGLTSKKMLASGTRSIPFLAMFHFDKTLHQFESAGLVQGERKTGEIFELGQICGLWMFLLLDGVSLFRFPDFICGCFFKRMLMLNIRSF